MNVELTWHDMQGAAHLGISRQLQNMAKARHNKHDCPDQWSAHIVGAIGERVACAALGIYWGWSSFRDVDCGWFEVRSTPRENGSLIAHEDDRDDLPFVLVCGKGPTFHVPGWIMGRDAKNPDYWKDDVRSPAYFVPQDKLLPIEELKCLMK